MFIWISRLWDALSSGDGFWQRVDDAYLAESIDTQELERRIRQLDQRPRFG